MKYKQPKDNCLVYHADGICPECPDKVLDTQIKECGEPKQVKVIVGTSFKGGLIEHTFIHNDKDKCIHCKPQEPKECECHCHFTKKKCIDPEKHGTCLHCKPQPLEWEEKNIERIVTSYCWDCSQRGHVKGFHDIQINELQSLLSLERKKIVEQVEGMKKYHKEFECTYGGHETFCESQECPNAPKEYNKALDSVLDILKGKGGK